MNRTHPLLRKLQDFFLYGESGSFAKPTNVLRRLVALGHLETDPSTAAGFPRYRITDQGIEALDRAELAVITTGSMTRKYAAKRKNRPTL